MTALLCACTSSIVSSGGASVSPARMTQVPGHDYKLLMPSEDMQSKIEMVMRAGKAPSYITMPQQQISHICGPNLSHVLGCVYESKVGKTIFITKSVRGEAKKMLLVHEYAHYLYGWQHS